MKTEIFTNTEIKEPKLNLAQLIKICQPIKKAMPAIFITDIAGFEKLKDLTNTKTQILFECSFCSIPVKRYKDQTTARVEAAKAAKDKYEVFLFLGTGLEIIKAEKKRKSAESVTKRK